MHQGVAECTTESPNAPGSRRMHRWVAECTRESPKAPASKNQSIYEDLQLQRILRFLCFTNMSVFLELLVLWCGVFSQILLFFWNYWFLVFVLNACFCLWIIGILLILLELLLNQSFTNIIGIIPISNNFTHIIGHLRHGKNIIQYYY